MDPRASISTQGAELRGAGSRRGKREGRALSTVRYMCTFQNTIADVLGCRGWKEVDENGPWDIVWADREWYFVFHCPVSENIIL